MSLQAYPDSMIILLWKKIQNLTIGFTYVVPLEVVLVDLPKVQAYLNDPD